MKPHPSYDVFPVVSCGIDWLTVTNNDRKLNNPLEVWADAEIARRLTSAGQLTYVKRLGYQGRSVNGLFVGRRPDGVCVQLSGPLCTPLAAEAITLSTNVSRIDTQVTVWTEGEQPHLAAWTRKQMLDHERVNGRPGRVDLILGHPDGETLNVNHRRHESFGRLYDKTAEAKLGPRGLLWRYEVEWKGRRARWVAGRLAEGGVHPQCVSSLVHDFWTKKGVEPAFRCHEMQDALEPYITSPDRDVLTWMRLSLSKCIATTIRRYGTDVTLEALGLSTLVQGGNDNVGSHQ